MEVLRIILTQNSANYKKEETVLNKMTYPLPPFSTIIGALHNACGYTTYHPMDISIQGKYESMHKEPYTDYCFLNSVMNDRGILVKLENGNLLSTAFEKVAMAKKPQGNDFRKGITIDVINKELLEEYRKLKDLSEEIEKFKTNRSNKILESIRKRKQALTIKKKLYKDDLKMLSLISKREKQIKDLEKLIRERIKEFENNNYKIPYSKFASLTTSLKYYEILNNVELILHIKSDLSTLRDIEKNIFNLKSIGRSEDFVDIREVCFVNVVNDDVDNEIISEYSSYIGYDLIKNDYINLRSRKGTPADGTKYYLNKNYILRDNKRVFEKKKVVYTSKYSAEAGTDSLYFDIGEEKSYIVNFI
ncbi:MAG: hypothetical protein H6Q69_231 [Firmicutes bacterium]|nr:hypothetical protein [Bacillota bacterium]